MTISITAIKYHQQRRILDITFADGNEAKLSAEYLRVYSPSAEVTGHSPDQAVLVTNKKTVGIANIEKTGNYAIKIHFDDGHNTGIYSWPYLHELMTTQADKWQDYLARLKTAKGHRDAIIPIKIT